VPRKSVDQHVTISSATLIPQPEPAGPSKEEIAKVVDEHREREARRAEKSKTKSDDGDEKDEKGDDKSKTSKTKDESESKIPSYGPPPIVGIPDSTASSTASKHRQFALHRGIFSMRERDVRAKEQGAKAKEVGKGKHTFLPDVLAWALSSQSALLGLPQVPRGQF